MEIISVFSFLVHPSKNEEIQPEIGGTALPLSGNLFDMLSIVFNKAPNDCNIDIAFLPTPAGQQNNQRRNDIVTLLREPTLDNARVVARRLQIVTTRRSGLGLLFIVLGQDNGTHRAYISRFPADFGIVAEEQQSALRVELLERVFMKNASSYKAVVYDGDSFDSDFWIGKATDKQITNKSVAVSGYWIREFLCSDFKTTSATGTRRLALAIKRTMDSTDDLEIKEELCAAARLARSLNKQMISMDNFAERFALSDKTREALTATLSDPTLRFSQFQFSTEEFGKHVRYRSLQISNGALLTAPAGRFEECFTKERIAEDSEEYSFTTRGKVVNERLRTSAS